MVLLCSCVADQHRLRLPALSSPLNPGTPPWPHCRCWCKPRRPQPQQPRPTCSVAVCTVPSLLWVGLKLTSWPARQVLAQADEAAAPAPQAILDMRGPQARLVTDMGDLNSEAQLAARDDTPMPELQHNLRLLVDLAGSDIQRLDGKLRQEQVGSPGARSPCMLLLHAAACCCTPSGFCAPACVCLLLHSPAAASQPGDQHHAALLAVVL